MGLIQKAGQLSELTGQYFHGNVANSQAPVFLFGNFAWSVSRRRMAPENTRMFSGADRLERALELIIRLRGKLLAVICRPSLCDHIAMLPRYRALKVRFCNGNYVIRRFSGSTDLENLRISGGAGPRRKLFVPPKGGLFVKNLCIAKELWQTLAKWEVLRCCTCAVCYVLVHDSTYSGIF